MTISARSIASDSDALTEDIVEMLRERSSLSDDAIISYAVGNSQDERLYRFLDLLEEDIALFNNLTLNRETWIYE